MEKKSSQAKPAFMAVLALITIVCPKTAASVRISRPEPLVVFTAWPAEGMNRYLDIDRIYSRIGTVSCVFCGPEGSSVKSMKAVLKDAGTTGTFNLRTGEWTIYGGITDIALKEGADGTYVLPGNYGMTVTFTVVCRGQVHDMTKTAYVTLHMGRVNDVTCSLDLDEDLKPAITVRVSDGDAEPASAGS